MYDGSVWEIDSYDYTCDPRMQISEVDEFGTITYLPRRKLTVEIPQDYMNSFNGETFQCEAFICGNNQSRAFYDFFVEKANSKSQEDLNSFSLEELRSNLVRTRIANNSKRIAIEEIEKKKQEEIERARRIEQERKNELIQAISSAQKKGKSLDKEIKSLRSDKEKMLGKNDANFTLNQILSTLLIQNQSQQV